MPIDRNFPFTEKIVKEITINSLASKKKQMQGIPNDVDYLGLSKELNLAYREFLGWKENWDKFPTKRQVLLECSDTKKHAEKSLKSVQSLNDNIQNLSQFMPSQLLFATEDAANELVDNLCIVLEHIEAIQKEISNNNSVALRRGGKSADTIFIGGALPDIYSKYFGRDKNLSTTQGKATGPLIRFISNVTSYCGLQYTNEAISSAIKGIKRERKLKN